MNIDLNLFLKKFLIRSLLLLVASLNSVMLLEAQTNSVIGSRPNVIYILISNKFHFLECHSVILEYPSFCRSS